MSRKIVPRIGAGMGWGTLPHEWTLYLQDHEGMVRTAKSCNDAVYQFDEKLSEAKVGSPIAVTSEDSTVGQNNSIDFDIDMLTSLNIYVFFLSRDNTLFEMYWTEWRDRWCLGDIGRQDIEVYPFTNLAAGMVKEDALIYAQLNDGTIQEFRAHNDSWSRTENLGPAAFGTSIAVLSGYPWRVYFQEESGNIVEYSVNRADYKKESFDSKAPLGTGITALQHHVDGPLYVWHVTFDNVLTQWVCDLTINNKWEEQVLGDYKVSDQSRLSCRSTEDDVRVCWQEPDNKNISEYILNKQGHRKEGIKFLKRKQDN